MLKGVERLREIRFERCFLFWLAWGNLAIVRSSFICGEGRLVGVSEEGSRV